MTDFDSFCESVEEVINHKGHMDRADFRRVVRQHAGCVLYVGERHAVKQDQIDFAKKLLGQGMAKSLISKRLVNLYECSSATAYRRIEQAFNELQEAMSA